MLVGANGNANEHGSLHRDHDAIKGGGDHGSQRVFVILKWNKNLCFILIYWFFKS